MSAILYICYFGINEPLVQTQVLPYLRELQKDGHEITLLTFEPTIMDRDGVAAGRVICGDGIKWQWLRYHKRLSVLATLWDVLCGTWFIHGFVAREKPDILHARVHVPALMGAIARKLSRRKPKLLFDIRGFMPEEYTDAGIWPEGGVVYRLVKRVERWLFEESDGFVVLTEKAREILFPGSYETGFDNYGRPVEVIPCCVDFVRRFSGDHETLRTKYRDELELRDRFVIIHLGALGGLYLVNEIADLLAAAKKQTPSTFALFLTQSDRHHIESLLHDRGFSHEDYFIGKVNPTEVEGYLHASDIGLSIVKASFATSSRSPTKIPEYLACGLPIIANTGVGDVDELIKRNGVGAILKDFRPTDYAHAFSTIESLGDVSDNCRETAWREFDLVEVGGKRYRRLYSRLTTKPK